MPPERDNRPSPGSAGVSGQTRLEVAESPQPISRLVIPVSLREQSPRFLGVPLEPHRLVARRRRREQRFVFAREGEGSEREGLDVGSGPSPLRSLGLDPLALVQRDERVEKSGCPVEDDLAGAWHEGGNELPKLLDVVSRESQP